MERVVKAWKADDWGNGNRKIRPGDHDVMSLSCIYGTLVVLYSRFHEFFWLFSATIIAHCTQIFY